MSICSLHKLSNLPIARIVVTNTLPQTHLMEEYNGEVEKHHRAEVDGHSIADELVESPISTVANGINRLPNGTSNRNTNTANGSRASTINGSSSNGGASVSGKLTVLDISPVLAESIRRTHNGESISLLFGEWAERAGMGY